MNSFLKILFLIIWVPLFSNAQKFDYNWCFGDSCGIHFTDSSTEFFESALSFDPTNITTLESAASISDSSGNLLFYTSGSIVWNKNHQVMTHGDSLLEDNTITQGALIIPKPDDSLRYYIFHIYYHDPPGFYYSVVNMSLDNHLGDVEENHKNILLDTSEGNEKLTAVKHANGRDWWILHREYNTSRYYIYLLTPDTLILYNVQSIGYATNNLVDAGEMNFSPAGDKLITLTGKGKKNLLDFDRCTGELSNLIDLSYSENTFYYGSSFSPDGSKLYVSSTINLFQYDLNAPDIAQSKELIWTDPYGDPESLSIGYNLFQHQLAPDGKIYIVLSGGNGQGQDDTFLIKYLCVINKPNEPGTLCDFQPYNFFLAGHHVTLGLPNLPNYNLGALEGSACDTLYNNITATTIPKDQMSILPNPANTSIEIQLPTSEMTILNIYNFIGEKLEEETINGRKIRMDISSFPSGCYLIKNNSGLIGKFIKE